MADENTGAPTPAPTPAPTAAPTPAPTPRQDSDTEKNLRAENAAHRIEARKEAERADKLQKDLENAKAETEKRVKDAESPLRTKLEKQQERIKHSELKAAASAAGLSDLDLLPLIKTDGIQIDEDGNVTGIEEAIKAFKESKPAYFEEPKGGSGGAEPKPGSTGSKKPAPASDPKTPPTNVKKLDKKDYEAAKRSAVNKLRA